MSYRPLLDKVRWLSALLVAAGHAIALLNDPLHGNLLLKAVAEMRSPAVIVFFVLSGYLVGGVVIKGFPNFQLRRYAIARFARIYIVLIPALLLTVLIDGAVFHFDHLNPLFSQVWPGGALGSTPVFARYTVGGALASLLCLEPLIAEPLGSAGSLWSLGNEWIYYFAFPALFAAGLGLGGFRAVTVLAFGSALLVAVLSRMEAAFWLAWLAGAYANTVDLSRILRSARLTQTLRCAGFAAGIAGIALGSWLGMRVCIIVISVAGFVLLATGSPVERPPGRSLDQSLAGFSYSLYVTHLQIMTLLAAMLFRSGLLPQTGIRSPLSVMALALAMLGICIAVAYGFATLFEDRTADFARWLTRRFQRTPVGHTVVAVALATLLVTAAPAARSAAPALMHTPGYESPVRADPDDLLMIGGSGFRASDRVVYAATAGPATDHHPETVPQHSDAAHGIAAVVQVGDPAYAITVRMPQDLLPGHAYRLWVVNAENEWSDPVSINDPRPQWFSPPFVYATQDVANLGRRLRVIGRNLTTQMGASMGVRLRGPHLYDLQRVPATTEQSVMGQYLVESVLPPALTPGIYTVSVRRSDGGWVEIAGQRLEVRPDPPAPRDFTLGDPQFGSCHPDDDQDDSACFMRVIEAARQAGAGRIIIPRGRWLLSSQAAAAPRDDGFVLPQNVQLQGTAPAGSVIVRHEPAAANHSIPLLTLTGHNLVSGITFVDDARFRSLADSRPILRLGPMSDARASASSHEVADIVITGNVFLPVGIAITDDAARPLSRLFITGNQFGAYSEALNFPGGAFHAGEPFRLDDSVIRANRFVPGSYIDLVARQGTIASEIGAALRLDFSANVADGASTAALQEPTDPKGFRAAFFWNMNNSLENLLIAQNQVTCSGDKDGDGEAIAFDGSGNTLGFKDAPAVGSAGADWITVSASRLADLRGHAVPRASYYRGHWLQIVDGPGVGQVRRIVGYEEDASGTVTLHVAPRWDVPPKALASRVAIGREFWQAFVVANQVDQRKPPCQKSNLTGPNAGTIAVAGPTADSVVAGNTQWDTNGVYFNQTYTTQTPSCPRCSDATTFQTALEIRDNRIEGEYDWSSDCSYGGILGSYSSSPTPESAPPTVGFGVAISHNTIVHADSFRGGAIDFALTWYSGPPPGDWPFIRNALVFHNVLSDISGPAPRAVCRYGQKERSGIRLAGKRNLRDTVLYANSCRRVDKPLIDAGSHTTRLCSTAADSCECPKN